jgi:hypothetical protein
MRQYIGTIILALLGIALGALAIATSWWAYVLIALLSVGGAVLLYPVRKSERSAFGIGDFSGSRFGNVYSDADDFIRGTAREALFINIIHRSRGETS